MFVLRFLSALLVALFLSFSMSSIAFAQDSSVQLQVTAPEQVQGNEEVVIIIEVTDEEGNPLAGADPEISFDPGHVVVDEVLYDCGDPEWYDGCGVNHRAVQGIFEVSFELIGESVEVVIDVAGQQEVIELSVSESSAVIPQAKANVVPSVQGATIGEVQVGPSTSFWFLILPLVALCAVVTFFVFSTTD